MTGLVSRLVIPAPIQAAWEIVKPLLPFIAILVGAVILIWHFESVGEAQQKARDAKAIAALTQQRDSWITAFHASDANFRTAIGMANDEAANIRAIKADGDARAARAVAERDAALKANKTLTTQAATLRDSAKRHYSTGEPCTSSADLMNAKDL